MWQKQVPLEEQAGESKRSAEGTLLSALTTEGALVTNFKRSFLMANDW